LPDLGYYTEQFREMAKKVFLGPPLAFMIKKTAAAVGDERTALPEVPKDSAPMDSLLYDYIRSEAKIEIPARAFTFPPPTVSAKEDLPRYVEDVVSAVLTWMASDEEPDASGHYDDPQFVLKDTSPGMPWIVTKDPAGRPWGSCHSPGFLSEFVQDPDCVMRRFLRILMLGDKKAGFSGVLAARSRIWAVQNGTPTHSPAEAVSYAAKMGGKLYRLLKNTNQLDPKATGIQAFRLHITSVAMAGNIKPVDREEIEDFKPNRTVWSSPALLRFLGARIGHLAYAYFSAPNYHKPGWMRGGTARYLDEIVSGLRLEHTELVYTPVTPALPHLHDIMIPGVVSINPDIKSMDLSVRDRDKRAAHDMTLANIPAAYSRTQELLLACALGFYFAAEMEMECLTNSGVFYYPKDINGSGSNFTYIVNQLRSLLIYGALHGKLPYQKYKIQKSFPAVRIFHRSVGDDQDIKLYFTPEKDVMNELVFCNSRADSGGPHPFALKMQKKIHAAWMELVTEIERYLEVGMRTHTGGFKKETLKPFKSLSGGSFLAHHVFATNEFGEMTPIAVRPLADICFSVVWPKRPMRKYLTEMGATHNGMLALRSIAAFIEGAIAYPHLRGMMDEVFERATNHDGTQLTRSPIYASEFDELLSVPASLGMGVFDATPTSLMQSALDAVDDDELEEFSIGHLPTLAQAWAIQTGSALPRAVIEESEEISEATEVDLDGLEEGAPAPEQPSEPKQSEIEEEIDDFSGLEGL
jgi:hypothetical protein